jgi:hypothetical protein
MLAAFSLVLTVDDESPATLLCPCCVLKLAARDAAAEVFEDFEIAAADGHAIVLDIRHGPPANTRTRYAATVPPPLWERAGAIGRPDHVGPYSLSFEVVFKRELEGLGGWRSQLEDTETEPLNYQAPDTSPAIAPLMTVSDVAGTLRSTRRTVERMRAAGEFPKPDLHVGRCPRWLPTTVQDWLTGQANG